MLFLLPIQTIRNIIPKLISKGFSTLHKFRCTLNWTGFIFSLFFFICFPAMDWIFEFVFLLAKYRAWLNESVLLTCCMTCLIMLCIPFSLLACATKKKKHCAYSLRHAHNALTLDKHLPNVCMKTLLYQILFALWWCERVH